MTATEFNEELRIGTTKVGSKMSGCVGPVNAVIAVIPLSVDDDDPAVESVLMMASTREAARRLNLAIPFDANDSDSYTCKRFVKITMPL